MSMLQWVMSPGPSATEERLNLLRLRAAEEELKGNQEDRNYLRGVKSARSRVEGGFDPLAPGEENDPIFWNPQQFPNAEEAQTVAAQAYPEQQRAANLKKFYPEEEAFGGAAPIVGVDPETGQRGFFERGSKGTMRRLDGVAPPEPERELPDFLAVLNEYRSADEADPRLPYLKSYLDKQTRDDKGKALTPVEIHERNFGKVPADHSPVLDRDGMPTGRVAPMAGGPLDPANVEKKEADKLAADLPQAEAMLTGGTQIIDQMLAQIQRIKTNKATPDVIGSLEGREGYPNTWLDDDKSTAWSNVQNLRGAAQVRALQTMRDQSKTGGAVGSVTEREWPKLESMLANLDPKQGEGAYFEQLTALENQLTATKQVMTDTFAQTYRKLGGNKAGWSVQQVNP